MSYKAVLLTLIVFRHIAGIVVICATSWAVFMLDRSGWWFLPAGLFAIMLFDVNASVGPRKEIHDDDE